MERKKIKILAIDDNPDNIITIKALIMEAFPDALVLTSFNGLRGLELAAEEDPDVILLDIVMPDMDGFTVCQKLKDDKKTSEIPVVFVTAIKGDKASRIKALEVGADAFLAKPIDESELVAQIRAMVKIRTASLEKKNENLRLTALVEERTRELNENYVSTVNLFEDLNRENTRRKETEKALIESQEKYSTLIENSSEAIYVIQNEKFVFANPACNQISGISSEELLGKSLLDFVSDDQKHKIKKQHKDLSEGLVQTNNGTYSLRKPQGDIVWLTINSVRIIWNDMPASLNFASDITERKNAEDALKESEGKYRDMANLLPQIVFEIDLNGVVTYVNEQSVAILGYTCAELLGQKSVIVHVPEERDRIVDLIQQKPNSTEVVDREYTMLRKDGTVFSALIYTSGILKDNNLIGFRGIIIDITDRKKVEEELVASELKYRDLMDNSPEGITIYIEGKIAYINQEATRLMRAKDKSELLGKSITDFINNQNKELILERMKYVALSPVNVTLPVVEEIYTRLDGTEMYVEIKVMPIIFDNKFAVQISGHDITDRIEAQEKIRQSELFLKETQNIARLGSYSLNLADSHWVSSDVLNEIFGIPSDYDKSIEGWASLIHPDWQTTMAEYFEKEVIGKSTNFDQVYKIVRQNDKSERWVHGIGELQFDENHQIIRMIGSIQDISDIKKAEDALRESESKYFELFTLLRSMSDTMPDMMWAKNLNNEYIFANEAFCKRILNAVDTSEPIGKTDIFFAQRERDSHPDNPNWHTFGEICADTDVITLQEMKEMQFDEYGNVKGEFIFLDVNKSPLFNQKKELIGVVGSGRDVTERRKTLQALEDNRTEIKAIYDNAPVLMCVVDEDRRVLFANDAFNSYSISLEADININEPFGNILGCLGSLNDSGGCGLGEQCIKCSLKMSIEDTFATEIGHSNLEYDTILQKNGKQREVSLLGSTAIIETAGKKKLLLCFIDITERKQAEEALQKSEMFLRTFIENTPFEIWANDVNNIGILENKKMVDHFGSILGKTSTDLSILHPETVEVWEKNNKRVFEGELIDEIIEYEIDNKIYSYQQIIFPIYNNETIIGISGFNIDISERKRMERELMETQLLYHSFIEQLPNPVFRKDSEGRYVLVNSQFCKLKGISKEEFIGKMPLEITENEDSKHTGNRLDIRYSSLGEAIHNEIMQTGDTYELEEEYPAADGSRPFMHVLRMPVVDSSGAVVGSQGIMFDITERKEAEKALNQSEEQLKKFASHLQNVREEEKIALAREIHDDLGQILVALKIDMGMLKQKVIKSNTFVGSEDILTKFDNLVDLIDTTIKTARRIMNGLRPEQLDLLGFVEATRQYLLEFEGRHHLTCEFVSNIIHIEITSQQSVALFRIVQEALNNIVKHAKASQVTVHLTKTEDKLLLEVQDNGIGFDMNNKGRQDSYGMIGMRERVFLLGGVLNISSQVGLGTMVKVEVPSVAEPKAENKNDHYNLEIPFD